MGTLKVVAVKQGYLKRQARLVQAGTVLDISDERLVKDKDGKPALDKNGCLVKNAWLRPVKSDAEAAAISAAAKRDETEKGKAAAIAASGGKAAKDKIDEGNLAG